MKQNEPAHPLLLGLLLTWIFSTAVPEAFAGSTGTAFDTPLDTLTGYFTGPIAYTVSLLGIIVAGAALMFGGEIGDFTKKMILVVLLICLVALAGTLLQDLFGLTTAQIHP